jgi:amino acid adenylation domain-containing protein
LPENVLEQPVFELFAAVAERAPDAIALEDGEAELSYGDMLRQATHVARSIAQTVEPGEPVGIALPNGVQYPVAMLAALASGRPFVPLDLTFPAERNALIVRQSGMQAVIVDNDTRAAMRAMEGAPPLLDFTTTIEDSTNAPIVASPDDVALITYTSGSEGRPKGVYLSQRSLIGKAANRMNMAHVSAEDRLMLLYAPAVAGSQARIWASLLSGACLVIVDLRRKGLQEAARVMVQRGITMYTSPPYVFRRLMEFCRDPAPVTTVREVNLGSDRIFATDVSLFRERFPTRCCLSLNFGASEANSATAWFVPRDMMLSQPLMPVGYALPDREISVVDEEGQPVPRGEIGEITIAGRHLAEGYWRDEALTRRAFTVDPRDAKRRIYRSGDLGRMQADGLLELVGRKDRQIKIRGLRVEPTEIEAVIRGHRAIRDAAIIPRPAGDGVDIVAYATTRPNLQPPTEAALSAWLAERLPHAMRTRHIYLVDALPFLASFKPDIRKLEALDRERAAAEAVAAPMRNLSTSSASVNETVRNQWERVLGRASFDANLSWEEAGGDSLKALEFVFSLENILQRPVAMAVVGPATRPSELIAALQADAQDLAGGAGVGSQGQMRLFYLPGYSGLVFHEASLVQALARDLRIEVLDYPPLIPTQLQTVLFDDIVTHIVRAIYARRHGAEPVGLLGYSFGGYVAFAAASCLKSEGVELTYLGIVDVSAPGRGPFAPDIVVPELPEGRRPSWAAPVRWLCTVLTRPRYAFDRLITVCIDGQRFAQLASLWRVLAALRLRSAQVRFRVLTMRLLRLRARVRHVHEPYPGPIALFYALDNKGWSQAALPDDLGWSEFCTAVEVTRIPGDHVGMLAPGNLEMLTRAIRSQYERCMAKRVGTERRVVEP